MISTNKIVENLLNGKEKITPTIIRNIDNKINELEKNFNNLVSINVRKKTLILLKSFLLKNKEQFIKLINLEVFKTLDESSAEFNYAIEFVNYSLKILNQYKFEILENKNTEIFLKSSGIVFAITPYNDPLAGMIRKIAPSIAAGSPLIVKTSSYNLKICKFIDLSLPKEIKKFLKFVYIKKKNNINRIIQNKKIKIVTFTGSTEIGLKLNNIKTKHLQKKILELGGINYAVICDNHNLDNIVNEIITRKIKAAGQACSSINKVFVKKNIKNEFENLLKIKVSKLICGNINQKVQPDFGPVISTKHYKFLEKLKNKLLRFNRLIVKSKSNEDAANLYPFIITESNFDDNVFDKIETFGPLLGISYFNDEKKLFKKISSSEYSLVCYIFSRSKQIISLAKKLDFGSIGINTTKIQSPGSPTGGNNLSGIGREGGIWGFEEFLSTVNYVKGNNEKSN